jgi:hypothetical protein
MRRAGSPASAGNQQGDTKFKPGRSGNPKGRAKGSRNQITLAMEALLDGESEALTRKAIELALGGDLAALRICLDRILPSRKDRPITLEMPPIAAIEDAPRAMAAIAAAVAQGQITVSEASDVSRLVETYVRAVEASDLEKRLRASRASMRPARSLSAMFRFFRKLGASPIACSTFETLAIGHPDATARMASAHSTTLSCSVLII